MDRMSPLDASFLHIENDVNHMHIGSVAIFEGPPPPYEDVIGMIASKLHKVPRYRQRVHSPPAARSGSTIPISTSSTTSGIRLCRRLAAMNSFATWWAASWPSSSTDTSHFGRFGLPRA